MASYTISSMSEFRAAMTEFLGQLGYTPDVGAAIQGVAGFAPAHSSWSGPGLYTFAHSNGNACPNNERYFAVIAVNQIGFLYYGFEAWDPGPVVFNLTITQPDATHVRFQTGENAGAPYDVTVQFRELPAAGRLTVVSNPSGALATLT